MAAKMFTIAGPVIVLGVTASVVYGVAPVLFWYGGYVVSEAGLTARLR